MVAGGDSLACALPPGPLVGEAHLSASRKTMPTATNAIAARRALRTRWLSDSAGRTRTGGTRAARFAPAAAIVSMFKLAPRGSAFHETVAASTFSRSATNSEQVG